MAPPNSTLAPTAAPTRARWLDRAAADWPGGGRDSHQQPRRPHRGGGAGRGSGDRAAARLVLEQQRQRLQPALPGQPAQQQGQNDGAAEQPDARKTQALLQLDQQQAEEEQQAPATGANADPRVGQVRAYV